ncbi:MAG: metallophosphoesterase [Bacillota bacterium]|nr:metallophosphoesterase [Bacillota bacterium]
MTKEYITIGVFGDTHGNSDAIRLAVKRIGPADLYIHLGDYVRDVIGLAGETGKRVIRVRGNCDLYENAPEERVVRIGGLKFLITHGHKYRVKYGMARLRRRAEEVKADAVIYGHTHCAETSFEDGRVYFNPGSIAEPRSGQRPTYGVIRISGKKIVPMTYTLD